MHSLAENEGIANKSMFSGSPRYSAVFIVIDNGEVPERITEMSRQGEKNTRQGSKERRNRSCVSIRSRVLCVLMKRILKATNVICERLVGG